MKKGPLKDGEYPCHATLHVKRGKAVIVLHTMFGLKPGTTIPLLRPENCLEVVLSGGDPTGIKNGHAII